jgi:hypothetical protein
MLVDDVHHDPLLVGITKKAHRMIPQRYAPVLFGLVLSGLMSAIVSAIATLRTIGFDPDLLSIWAGSWATSWAVAFPTVLVVAPIARRLVGKLTRD